jgi:hypothetical protein
VEPANLAGIGAYRKGNGGKREGGSGRGYRLRFTAVPLPVSLFPVVMRLISIQIGTPRVYGVPGSDDPMDRVFTSAIGKEPVGGRVWAAQLGLSGDAVADRKSPGGAEQALLTY